MSAPCGKFSKINPALARIEWTNRTVDSPGPQDIDHELGAAALGKRHAARTPAAVPAFSRCGELREGP